eukprot:CFRG5502T1
MAQSISAQVLTNVLKLISASDPTTAGAVQVVTNALHKSDGQWPGVVDLFITAILEETESEKDYNDECDTVRIKPLSPSSPSTKEDLFRDSPEKKTHTKDESVNISSYLENIVPHVQAVMEMMDRFAKRPPTAEKLFPIVKDITDQIRILINEVDDLLISDSDIMAQKESYKSLVGDRYNLIQACQEFSHTVREYSVYRVDAQQLSDAANAVSKVASVLKS